MKFKVTGAIILAVLLLVSVTACGSNQGSNSRESSLSLEEQKAVMDKLAAEATEVPHPETMPSAGETSAPAADAGVQVGVARAEQLLGTWLDATNEDRTAKISKDGDTFLFEDNEGKYQGTFKDGVLILKISEDENDTARVFIDSKIQHLVMDYQGDIYEFNRKE